jgi:hypothetical protein
MKLPRTISSCNYSHQTIMESTNNFDNTHLKIANIIPQITYVSPRHKENIRGGQYNPCAPNNVICWGIGKHSRGYECCHPTQEDCGHGPTGRPQCDPNRLAAALVINRKLGDKDFHEAGLNRLVAGYM